MSYLNLDIDFFDHPKTRRLIGLLGRESEALPLRLWCYLGKYHPGDGRLSDYSVQEIESVLCWYGQSGQAVDALEKVGFLRKDSVGYYANDWLEHSGHLAAFKERANKGAKARWDKIRNKSPTTEDASSNACDASSNASSNAPTNQPTKPTKPNQPNQDGGLDFQSGFGLDLDERLAKLGIKKGALVKYRHADIVEVLRLYDTKVKNGETFRDAAGWFMSELKKQDTSDIPEDRISATIEALQASEAYARGHCPPNGKTIRQYAVEKLRRDKY